MKAKSLFSEEVTQHNEKLFTCENPKSLDPNKETLGIITKNSFMLKEFSISTLINKINKYLWKKYANVVEKFFKQKISILNFVQQNAKL